MDFVLTSLFTAQSRLLTTLGKRTYENVVGKEENAGNNHFLPFPQCFLPCQRHFFAILAPISIVVCKCFEFGKSNVLSFGKELKPELRQLLPVEH